MNEFYEKEKISLFCENCGVRIQNKDHNNNILNNNTLFCQYCGIEIKFDYEFSQSNIEKEKISCNSPLERFYYDFKFPKIFKQNLVIVISRLSYEPIRGLEQILKKKIKNIELTKELLDKLEAIIKPITKKNIKSVYLKNLYNNMKTEEFCNFHKILREIINSNSNFNSDFIVFLRWIINRVFIITKEKWKKNNIKKLERIIRTDLKNYFPICSNNFIKHRNLWEKSNNSREIEGLDKKRVSNKVKNHNRYFRNPININLEKYVKTVIGDYKKKVRFRKRQVKLEIGASYFNIKSNKNKINLNRGQYNYSGIVYRIIDKRNGKMLYGFTTTSIEERLKNYIEFAEKKRYSPNILKIEQEILNIKDSGQNVYDIFIIIPVDICFNMNTLRKRENYWINKHKTLDFNYGYNSNQGGGGGPKIKLPMFLIAEYIAKGYYISEISDLLFNKFGFLIRKKTISRRIIEYWGGKYQAQKKFLKKVLIMIIEDGYKTNDIINAFGHRGRHLIERIFPRLFNGKTFTEVKKKILTRLVRQLIIEGMGQKKIVKELRRFGWTEINNCIKQEWGNLREARQILWKPLIMELLRNDISGPEIFMFLGYKNSTSINKHNQLIRSFFWGMNTEEAKQFIKKLV